MLTGLLFAIEEAVDDPAQLVAALPFAGATVIEHQARQLIAAGAGQIMVLGDPRHPALIGALHRIGRRGVPLDTAGCAAEAVATLHPLARVLMLADGLVTTDAVVRVLAAEGGEALLVVPADEAPATLERIGGASAWAGIARVGVARLAELARLPADYDPQAALVRLAEEAGAARLSLPADALRDGHGIERDAAALAIRGQRIVAAALATPGDWFERVVAAPLARAAMPALTRRGIETGLVIGVAASLAAIGAAALVADWPRSGMLLTMAGILVAGIGGAAARLRGEPGWQRVSHIGIAAAAALAALALGWRCSASSGDGTAMTVAIALIVATMLTDRTGAAPAFWWGGAGACVLLVAVATLLGVPVAGLMLASGYATAALTAAIDAVRHEA